MSLKNTTYCYGYQQILAAATVAAVGLTIPVGANGARPALALIQAEAQALRWRDDGVAPTASVGMILAVGATLVYDGDLSDIQFINAAGGTIINISYYS